MSILSISDIADQLFKGYPPSTFEECETLLAELPPLKKKPSHMEEYVRGRQIAFAYYNRHVGLGDIYSEVSEDSEKTYRQRAYIMYNKARHLLIQHYRQVQAMIEVAAPEERHHIGPSCAKKASSAFHAARYSVEIYERLKADPTIGEPVLNPVAMPVEVAEETSLRDMFAALRAEQPLSSSDVAVFTKGAIFSDGRADMCKQVLGPDHIGAYLNSLKDNPNIKHFLLGNNIIGSKGAWALADFLLRPHRAQLLTYYLAGNAIDGAGMAVLATALSTDTTMQSLWLKRNPLGLGGASALAELLARNTSLVTLDLQNTGLFDEGCAALFEGLAKHPTLTSLYLDANALTARSAETIAAYFEAGHGQELKHLSLGINRFGDTGAVRLASALSHSRLVSLNINSNRIESRGLDAILRWARGSTTLKCLDVGHYKSTADMCELPNNFSDPAAAKVMASFIESNTPLEQLCFTTCLMPAASLAVVAKAVERNTHLLNVRYQQHHLADAEHDLKTITRPIEKVVSRNWRVFAATYLRAQKHGSDIWTIDSIYRNKM